MSAYIVAEHTLNAATHAMMPTGAAIPCEQFDQMGRTLWGLNRLAVIERYGERAKDNLTEEQIAAWTYTPKHYTPMQRFVALSCLVYQCSEGKVIETGLYQEMTKAANRLARDIVKELPEFKTACKELW